MERAPKEDISPVLIKLAATCGRCYEFLSYIHVSTLFYTLLFDSDSLQLVRW